MEGGTRLAVAILVLFLAMVCFFFAFHPNGVENVKNPDSALQWLMGEFDVASSTPGSNTTLNPGAVNAVNTSVPSTNITNVSGTNVGP
jgi:hypothetical protein